VSPVYTPPGNAPVYVDYLVCGTPIATACGYVAVCDTIRIYNIGPMSASVTPNPATFCASGSGVLLSASASGGYGGYSYIWKDQAGNTLGTNSSYNANAAGIITVEVRDSLYNTSTCPSVFVSVPVTVGEVPVVNAGSDNMLCPDDPEVILNGTVQHATGGIWSGGAGTFDPDAFNLQASYIPTQAELNAGVVTLILTSSGAGGGCPESYDTVKIYYPPLLTVSLANSTVECNNSTTALAPSVAGGVPPYNYLWNTGSTGSSVSVPQGNYCVQITDNMGCSKSVCTNVIAPAAISVVLSSSDVTINGGSDGTATAAVRATAAVSGGNSPYTYLWSPGGQTTAVATGLSYGIYSVVVTDANGCSFNSSIVVNEPRCASFDATASAVNVLCYGQPNASATVAATGGTQPY
jgi:large repetitive protein